jgi:hypothetical protein
MPLVAQDHHHFAAAVERVKRVLGINQRQQRELVLIYLGGLKMLING